MADPSAYNHLEALRQDVRDEIKRRIEQRDKYSIQMTMALGAIFAIASSGAGGAGANLGRVIIVAPLIAIYFTVLILYSYRIHRVLAKYLRDKVEPELARVTGVPLELEWENYYTANEVPGIRRSFFIVALWAV